MGKYDDKIKYYENKIIEYTKTLEYYKDLTIFEDYNNGVIDKLPKGKAVKYRNYVKEQNILKQEEMDKLNKENLDKIAVDESMFYNLYNIIKDTIDQSRFVVEELDDRYVFLGDNMRYNKHGNYSKKTIYLYQIVAHEGAGDRIIAADEFFEEYNYGDSLIAIGIDNELKKVYKLYGYPNDDSDSDMSESYYLYDKWSSNKLKPEYNTNVDTLIQNIKDILGWK